MNKILVAMILAITGQFVWSQSAPQQADSPSLMSISSSSTLTEPDDMNAYHPVKLLDNDPKTMWAESVKGSGIGESLTMTFKKKITVDEVKFMPGCFFKEYWQQNNRVKKLELRLDDSVYQISFTDEMTVQGIKLPSAVSFSKLVFVIKEIYPTTKWEDTAVSEIMFFKDGVQLKIDFGPFAGYLKKAL